MAAAIEAEQRAIAAADAARQRASGAVVVHESGALSRVRRDAPATPVVPAVLSGAAAAARRLDAGLTAGGSAQARGSGEGCARTGGDGVARRAVL